MPKPTTLCAAALAVVIAMGVLMGAVPKEAAVVVLTGALALGLAVVLVCFLLIGTVGRRRVPPRHGTVETGGATEQAVIFGLSRLRLVLAVIMVAATVPMVLYAGGLHLIEGFAAVRAGERGWTSFLLIIVPPAVPFLALGAYAIERMLWLARSLRLPAHVACTAAALHIQVPEMRIALSWDDVLGVQCNGRMLGVAVGDDSPVWTRHRRTAHRNLNRHGFPICVSVMGVSHAPLMDEVGKHLDG